MKLRWTIILAAVNAVLLWIVAEQIIYSPSQKAFDSQVRSFLPLSKADWDGLGVTTPAGGWKVSRDKWGQWWLRSPTEWPAKTSVVAKMNGYLATLGVDSAFAVAELGRVGQGLKSYGLETPRAIVEVSSAGKTLSFKVGNTTPLGNKVYVASADGKEVWVVDAGINEYLALTPEKLRQEGFFPFNVIELEALELEQGTQTTRFERKTGEGLWQLKLGERSFDMKPGLWESWLVELGKLSAAADATEKGLGATWARLNFQMLYGRRSLTLGELNPAGNARAARWEGTQETFYVPVESLAALQRPESFLEPRALPLNPQNVTALDWTRGQTRLALRKLESNQWVIASANNAPADSQAVAELLEGLCTIEAKPSLDRRPPGQALSEKVRLQSPEQNVELELERTAGAVVAHCARSRIAYVAGRWPELPSQESLLDREILPGKNSAELTDAVWQTPGGRKKLEPASPPRAALEALLKGTWRAERWQPEGWSPVGPATGKLELSWGQAQAQIELWKGDSGWMGRAVGNPRTFVADAPTVALLEALLAL